MSSSIHITAISPEIVVRIYLTKKINSTVRVLCGNYINSITLQQILTHCLCAFDILAQLDKMQDPF